MKKSLIWLVFFLVCFPKGLMAQSVNNYPLWQLVAQSDLIIIGVPYVPTDQIEEGLQERASHYITFEVSVKEVLKGERKKDSLEIIYWPVEEIYRPSPLLLRELSEKDSIFFLDEIDDEDSKSLNFAGHTPNALQPFDREVVSRLQEEVAYQQTVLKNFETEIKTSELAHYEQVKRLIQDLTIGRKQLDNFNTLEQLGEEAVPAIIYLMDDFRKLPIKRISLENPPGFFELQRHYSPERVVDALAAILNQITGTGFGTMIYNGASNKERQRTIDGWRIYLHYQQRQDKQ